ncbi:DUF4124 domain-containing protein [Desulfocicer niacini]
MRRIIFLWTMAILMIPTFAPGEYFRYVDENGVVSYTDDLSKVPERQRNNVDSFVSVKKQVYEHSDQKEGENKNEGEKEVFDDDASSLNVPAPDLENSMSQEMMALKEALDQEFAQLNEARAALLVEKQKIGNQTDVSLFNQKAGKLNDRIKAFELKKEAYLKKVVAEGQ